MADSGDLVLRFLSSIGRPAEAQQYLDLFRSEHPERFAIVHVADAVVRHAADALAVELRYLVELGLEPVLTFGAIEPRGAARAAERLAQALGPVASRHCAPNAADVAAVCRAGAIPLCTFEREDHGADGRFDAIAELAGALGTRKLVFVTRRSGFQPTGGRVVSIIDLTTERDTGWRPAPCPPSRRSCSARSRACSTASPTASRSASPRRSISCASSSP